MKLKVMNTYDANFCFRFVLVSLVCSVVAFQEAVFAEKGEPVTIVVPMVPDVELEFDYPEREWSSAELSCFDGVHRQNFSLNSDGTAEMNRSSGKGQPVIIGPAPVYTHWSVYQDEEAALDGELSLMIAIFGYINDPDGNYFDSELGGTVPVGVVTTAFVQGSEIESAEAQTAISNFDPLSEGVKPASDSAFQNTVETLTDCEFSPAE